MLDGDISPRQLDAAAATVVHHELDLVLTWRALHEDAQLLEQPETRVVILVTRHHDAQHALFRRMCPVHAIGRRLLRPFARSWLRPLPHCWLRPSPRRWLRLAAYDGRPGDGR